jgi:putative DNA-invertase from lambdoid prophage Rac
MPNEPTNPTTYGLCRVSTDEQTNAQQLDQITAACKQLDLGEPVMLEEPLGTSGYFTRFAERPQGQRLWNDCKRGDTIVMTKLDRLGRSIRDILATKDHFDGLGVRLIILEFMGGAIDTATPMGKLLFYMRAAFAEFERDLISERTKAALASLKARGVKLGRASPNYTYSDATRAASRAASKKWMVQSARQSAEFYAPILPTVERMAARGRTQERIARVLNLRGSTTITGRTWTRVSVQRLMALFGIPVVYDPERSWPLTDDYLPEGEECHIPPEIPERFADYQLD